MVLNEDHIKSIKLGNKILTNHPYMGLEFQYRPVPHQLPIVLYLDMKRHKQHLNRNHQIKVILVLLIWVRNASSMTKNHHQRCELIERWLRSGLSLIKIVWNNLPGAFLITLNASIKLRLSFFDLLRSEIGSWSTSLGVFDWRPLLFSNLSSSRPSSLAFTLFCLLK